MEYQEVLELLQAVTTPDDILALQMLLEHHNIARQIWLDTQAKPTPE